MAWGIIMTGLTLVGMFGLVIFEITRQEEPSASADSRAGASTTGVLPRAA